jgi:hypothetical protein
MSRIIKVRGDPAAGDPFLEDFFRDLSPALARSFSGEQLRAIKMNSGARTRGAHMIDLRFTVPLLRRYCVILMGRERRAPGRRTHDRSFHPIATLGNIFALAALAMVVALPIFLVGYGVKSFMGIDMINGGGAHALVEELRQNLVLTVKGM